jgi:hypothetical protein
MKFAAYDYEAFVSVYHPVTECGIHITMLLLLLLGDRFTEGLISAPPDTSPPSLLYIRTPAEQNFAYSTCVTVPGTASMSFLAIVRPQSLSAFLSSAMLTILVIGP